MSCLSCARLYEPGTLNFLLIHTYIAVALTGIEICDITACQVWGIRTMYSMIYGKAGMQLGNEVANNIIWPDPPHPFGVIAGTRSLGLGSPVSWMTTALHMIPGNSDGTVTVQETKLPSMCDFATVHATHTGLIDHPATEALILKFLQTGCFQAAKTS